MQILNKKKSFSRPVILRTELLVFDELVLMEFITKLEKERFKTFELLYIRLRPAKFEYNENHDQNIQPTVSISREMLE
jgi:hypothetical protein